MKDIIYIFAICLNLFIAKKQFSMNQGRVLKTNYVPCALWPVSPRVIQLVCACVVALMHDGLVPGPEKVSLPDTAVYQPSFLSVHSKL
jgi:hypothetical protein